MEFSQKIPIFSFSPTQEENGRWLVCLAAHQAYGPEQRTASIELEVFYAPKVRVEVDTANSQVFIAKFEGNYT